MPAGKEEGGAMFGGKRGMITGLVISKYSQNEEEKSDGYQKSCRVSKKMGNTLWKTRQNEWLYCDSLWHVSVVDPVNLCEQPERMWKIKKKVCVLKLCTVSFLDPTCLLCTRGQRSEVRARVHLQSGALQRLLHNAAQSCCLQADMSLTSLQLLAHIWNV